MKLQVSIEGKIKHNIASAIDLNAKDDAPSCVDDTTLSQSKMNCVKSRGFVFDPNIEDDQDQVNRAIRCRNVGVLVI
ncbi:hypothetical protein Hdeb2414_s0361g00876591 [Helianthus debilis subsp. tardiflorus]